MQTDLGKISITPGGTWVSDFPYEKLTIVEYNGRSYLSKHDDLEGVNPETDTAQEHWQKLTERGESLYQLMVRLGLFHGTELEFAQQYQQTLQNAIDAAVRANNAAAAAEQTDQAVSQHELARQQAETQRDQAETQREQHETTRDRQEQSRISAEQERVTSEQTRVSNEQTRVANEQTRVNQEAARVTAESTRVSQEAERVIAEQGRVQEFGEMVTQYNSDHARAEGDHTQAAEDHTQASSDHTQAAADHQTAAQDHSTAELDHTTAVQDHSTAESDHTRAEQDHTTAANDHTQAGTDHTTASEDHATAQSDHTTAANDHTQAGKDHIRAETDHTNAANDHTQAGTDHTNAANDHTRAETDHTNAANDHTQAGTDHTTAANDHTQAASDHQTAESDHTRAEGDHTQAAADHEQFVNFESGTYPDLTAGDITPDVDELIDITNIFTIQTTGGDADVMTGPAEFVEVRGTLDDDLNPFIADTFVSTGMNLVDDEQYITTDSKKGYYFPVVKGEWGEYGTSNKNNGYIVLAEDPSKIVAVYFSATKPTNSAPGSACPTHTDHSKTFYLPGDDGWLCIVMADDTVPQSCHIVWNSEMDEEAGVHDNQNKNIAPIVQAIHPWGMGALIGPYYSRFDRFNLRDKKTYSPIDRTLLTALTFTMTTEVGEGSTTYVFTAPKPTSMLLGGLWKTNYADLTIEEGTGNLVVRSNTITTLEDFTTAITGKLFYFERATEVTTNIDAATAAALLANVIDNFGLSYFTYNGELVTVPAYVTEAFHQTGKGQLFDGLARQALIEKIVAEVFCSLDKRIDGIDSALKNDIYKYVISSLTQGKFVNYRALNEFVSVFERRGADSPITQGIAPRYIGDIYRDTTHKIKYEAFGLTASDWVAMNS